MKGMNLSLVMGIIILALLAVWVDLPTNPGIHISLGPIRIDRDIELQRGLDLGGGTQLLLEADLPKDTEIDREEILTAKGIIEKRVSSLGVVEPWVQLQGTRGLLVEVPWGKDQELAIELVRERGLLEFIDAGSIPLPAGMIVETAFEEASTVTITPTAAITITPTIVPTEVITPGLPITPTAEITPTEPITVTSPAKERVFRTVMTSEHLAGARIGLNEYGGLDMVFSFTKEGGRIFADFTSRNVNKYLAIAMDKEIISCPRISEPIPEGGGARISTERLFTPAEARKVSIQLKYGALPLPFKVVEERAVGPTLGQGSIRRGARAGLIGFIALLLFILGCYRLPGLAADLALCIYLALVLALCKLIPITLSLSSLAGFFLSAVMALNANVLIFERVKEELRIGITPVMAVEVGFRRAWAPIRDSNIAMLIASSILLWFSPHPGGSMVRSFALALAIGVAVNMFTAIVVTRTFLRLLFALVGTTLQKRRWLLWI